MLHCGHNTLPPQLSRCLLRQDCRLQPWKRHLSSFPPRSRRKVLFSQSRFMILKGPVYLGAKLGFPKRSSLTNTWLAVRKDPATKGDALNRLRSNDSGEKVATFALANFNWSAADLLGLCSVWKQTPGTLRAVPYTTSALEVAVSTFGALRMPKRTHVNALDHDWLERIAQRRAFFNDRWKRSTKPLACRWYAVVVLALIPNWANVFFHNSDVNWAPLSVVTVSGIPKRATQLSMNACKTVSAVVSGIGTTSGHLVVRSTMVSRYLNPRSTAKGPTRLMCTCSKRVVGTGIGLTVGLVCSATLLAWQAWHCRAQRNVSRRMPGHVYVLAMMPRVALPERWDKLCTAQKIFLRHTRGTITRGLPSDVSHTRERSAPGNVTRSRTNEVLGSLSRDGWSSTNLRRSTSESV